GVDLRQEQGRDRTAGTLAHHLSAASRRAVVTRIDFYHDAEDRLAIACRLVAKAVQQKLRVVVYSPDAAIADAIDRMLWTTPPIAFVPHCRADHRLAAETPVLISGDDTPCPGHDHLLVNLHAEWPPSFARFQRLIEIVGRDDADKKQARAR